MTNNGKYTDLDLDHKKELLVNLKSLLLVTVSSSSLSGTNYDWLIKQLWQNAYDEVSTLTDADINNSIVEIEKARNPFTEKGKILVQKLTKKVDRE